MSGLLISTSVLLISAPALLISTSVLLISAPAFLISTSVLLISAPALLSSTSVLLISAPTLLISTSVLLISAPALLISNSVLLLVLWHSCPDYCYGTLVQYFGTPADAMTPQYCIVPSGTYCIASNSFLIIGLGS